MVAGFLGPLSTSEQISECRCFSAFLLISKENTYNILMFPCHPIIPILLLCFSALITKGRWSFPWSSLLEGVIIVVTSMWFSAEWGHSWGLAQVIRELSTLIEGNWPFRFTPHSHLSPARTSTHTLLGPQFPCGFPLVCEMQDRSP